MFTKYDPPIWLAMSVLCAWIKFHNRIPELIWWSLEEIEWNEVRSCHLLWYEELEQGH